MGLFCDLKALPGLYIMQCNIRYDIPGDIAHFERKVVAGEREVCWAGRVLKKEPELLEIEIDRGIGGFSSPTKRGTHAQNKSMGK